MKLSNYIIFIKKNNDIILMSLLSKSIVKLSLKQFNLLQENKFSEIDKEELEFLKNKFFITNLEDERNFVEFLIKRDMQSPISLSTYIMFTENCNFSCVYCYQKGQVCGKRISLEALSDICNWHKDILIRNNYKFCNIDLYGGEPLLEKDKLIFFANKMYDICKEIGVKLNLRLITNGYLLNEEIVRKLVFYGLRDIHLSIDGWGEVHNNRRPLRNGNDTFETIIENYKKIKDLCHVTIRTGFDKSNIKHLEEYISQISSLIGENEVYFAPIYNTLDQSKNACSYCSKNSLNSNELIEDYKYIYSLMKKYNLKLPNYVSSGPCMVGCADACIFDTEGNIFKCVDMIGIEELKIGNIKDYYNDLYYKFVKNERLKKCLDSGCKFVTVCGAGCVMKNYTFEKKLNKVCCEKSLFEELNKFLLDLKY